MKLSKRLLACLTFLLFATSAMAAVELKSGVFEPPRQAPDFNLPSSTGNNFALSQMRGKLVVLGFGFSHCPDICPMTLAKLAQVYRDLEDQAQQVQVVYVTVDPERDSVERLHQYMQHFDARFIGVTGPAEALAEVRNAYGIIAAKEVHKDGGYQVHHSSYLYLIDRQGLLRALVPFGKSAEDITHDLRILLQESPEQSTP
jgi:protein SCO1/2